MIATVLSMALLASSDTSAQDPAAQPTRASIVSLDAHPAENGLLVSFRVEGAFGPDVIDRVHSGLDVTFTHRLELVTRRAIPGFGSRVLARTLLVTSARYDSLTRQYYLARRTAREGDDSSAPTDDEDTHWTTSSLQEVEAWMCAFRDVSILGQLPEGGRKLRVRVRTVLGRHYRLLVFPVDDDAEAELVLER